MGIRTLVACSTITAVVGIGATDARAQAQTTDETPWSAEVAIGIDPSINGLVNSGAIGFITMTSRASAPEPPGRPARSSLMPSSVIRSFDYDPVAHRLDVQFVSGRHYSYHDVPAEVAEDMRRAFSKGSYFNRRIRNRYRYTRRRGATA